MRLSKLRDHRTHPHQQLYWLQEHTARNLQHQRASLHATFLNAFYTTYGIAECRKGRQINVTSPCHTSEPNCPDFSTNPSVHAAGWISEAHVCPASCSRGSQETLLYYRLLMAHGAPGTLTPTCLCHSLGRSQAPDTSTCKLRGNIHG